MNKWHYPRTKLAEQYLSLLNLGMSSNLALIAPRRMGKTLFVLQDIAPLALQKKYVPIYASLWQNIDAPHEGLINAMEEVLASLDKKTTLSRLLYTNIKKTSISNELLGKVEVEFAVDPTKPKSSELTYLENLLKKLEEKAGNKTVLLLIDEIQHLSTSEAFTPLAHAFRTMLDKRQGNVKCIFTGSSRHYMNLLLNESTSPFYHFVEPVQFPDLDEGFIIFLRKKMMEEHQLTIALPPLKKAFTELNNSPYWMIKLITQIITNRSSTPAALDQTLQIIEAVEDFESINRRLKAIDKIIFLALSNGENPFSQELLSKVDTETKVKGVASNVQRSIQRLSSAGLISQIHKGAYFIEKPGLKRYLEVPK